MIAAQPPLLPSPIEEGTDTFVGELPALTLLKTLRKMPLEARSQILREASEASAEEYRADLAKPPKERELTAFTALDSADPFLDDSAVSDAG